MTAVVLPAQPLPVPAPTLWLLRRDAWAKRPDAQQASVYAGEWVSGDRSLYLPALPIAPGAWDESMVKARRSWLAGQRDWTPVAWRSHWPQREGHVVGPQARFSALSCRLGLTGGAKGGGKSDVLLAIAIMWAGHPEYLGMLIRPTREELAPMIERAARLIPMVYPGAVWLAGERMWRFPTGAILKFRHCDPRKDDARRLAGAPVTFLGVDELTFQTQDSWDVLVSCVRSSAPGLPALVRCTTNPGGVGHHWVRGLFVEGADANGWSWDLRTKQPRCFVRSWLVDNPSLMQDEGYRLALEGMADDALREAYLGGNWDAFSGRVIRLVPGRHIITWADFRARYGFERIPAHWPRFRLLDWGSAHPYAAVWIACDEAGRGIVYRELYGARRGPDGKVVPNVGAGHETSHVAEHMARIERVGEKDAAGNDDQEHITMGWAGPDLFAEGRRDYGATRLLSEDFISRGIHFQAWNAAPGTRVPAKEHLLNRLRANALIFIREECPESIRTLPLLERSKFRPEDVDSDGEDHLYDAIKAFCLMRPWAAPPVAESTGIDPWDYARRGGMGWAAR